MIRPTENPPPTAMKLLPHQAALVETVFSPDSKRVVALRSDVGMGKSVALIAVAGRLLEERPMARALFVVPATLRAQFAYMLRAAGVPNRIVDRYAYRELLDATAEKEIWPTGIVMVLSLEFATQPDVEDSLAQSTWDIVFVYEWHVTKGVRTTSLRRILASAQKAVLASATPPSHEIFEVDTTVVNWRRDLVVDSDGKPLFTPPRLLFEEVSFSLDATEIELRSTVIELVKTIGGVAGAWDLRPRMLIRSLESSPEALERSLQSMIYGATAPAEMMEDLIDSEKESASIDKANEGTESGQVVALARRVLQQIEAINNDSKLNAFTALLSRIEDQDGSPRRVLVVTEFLATLFYLAAEIEAHMKCQLLYGAMGADERARSLQAFLGGSGILIASRTAIGEGINLRAVTDLLFYDLPWTEAAAERLLARLQQVGGVRVVNLYVLRATNIADEYKAGSSDRLIKLFRDRP